MARLPYLNPEDLKEEDRPLLKRMITLHRCMVNSPGAARAFSWAIRATSRRLSGVAPARSAAPCAWAADEVRAAEISGAKRPQRASAATMTVRS